jgi:type VI secretion system protein ImpL
MTHPGPTGASGARITAVTFDGRTVELFNQPGEFGLQRLIQAASQKRKDSSTHELSWAANNVTVMVFLKRVSSPDQNGNGTQQARGFQGLRLPDAIVGRAPAQLASAAGSQ